MIAFGEHGVSSAEAAADELDLGRAEALIDERLAPLQKNWRSTSTRCRTTSEYCTLGTS